jgi:hypothetical protein
MLDDAWVKKIELDDEPYDFVDADDFPIPGEKPTAPTRARRRSRQPAPLQRALLCHPIS